MFFDPLQCIFLCLLHVAHTFPYPTASAQQAYKSLQSYYKTVDKELSHQFPELNDDPFSMSQLEEAPKYILQLMRNRRGVKTNTVHGVQAEFGVYELSFAFAFNFPILDKRESLVRADLHIFVKRLVTRNRRRRAQISFHLIKPNDVLQTLRSFNLAQYKTGWDVIDVTTFIQNTILPLSRQYADLRLAITFEATKANGKIQEISLKRFVGPDGKGKPFIVLFTNDTRHLSIDRITRESSHLKLRKERNRERKALEKKLLLNRHKRSIDSVGPNHKLIHLPWHRRHKRRRRRKGRKRRKSRRNRARGRGRTKPKLFKPLPQTERNHSVDYSQRKCGLIPITLDFRDIGWHEWIISPQSFPINACAGTCQHLLWQAPDSISNHAFLQGVAHLISLPGSSVPPLGCVPVEFGSQTILYYDAKGNVAMREFPDMVVKKCGCR